VNVLAVDQGTSGTKALVVDETGAVLATAEESLRPWYGPDGAVEQDPQALLDSVLTAGRAAVAAAGAPVDVVTLANQGETVLAWDPASGRPLSPAIVWQDRRAEAVCAPLRDRAAEIARRTGLVLDPYFSAPKLAWLRRNVTRDGIATTTDAWLVHHLTGELVSDVTTASRSLLLDLDTLAWDPQLAQLFGLESEVLPRIVACDEVVGSTSAFGGDVPVGGLVVDQQAALFAEACLSAGEAKCTYGTGAFLLANVGNVPVRSTRGLPTSVAWVLRGEPSYCVDGQVYTAASAVRWLQDLGLVASAADLDAAAATAGEATRSGRGVLCSPALAGLGAPWWRPDVQGVVSGLSLGSGKGDIVLAVLRGIAAQVAVLARTVASDAGAPPGSLRVDGGLTRSRELMQAQADLLGVPVEVYPSPHATALGAAALARLAVDRNADAETVVGGWTAAEVFEPRWSADQAEDHLQRWIALVENTSATAEGAPATRAGS
jgi:glycerol kinase